MITRGRHALLATSLKKRHLNYKIAATHILTGGEGGPPEMVTITIIGLVLTATQTAIDTETPIEAAPMWHITGVLAEAGTQPDKRTDPRRGEGGEA
jgi:hypothetical protein